MRHMHLPQHSVLSGRRMEMGSGILLASLTHWQLKQEADGVAWLILDRAKANTNTLCPGILDDLDTLLDTIETLGASGLIIRSAKQRGFMAGFEIRDLQLPLNEDEITARLHRAHEVADRLAALDIPTVAVVHGHCLGAGLELALACRHRIAIHGARLGLPQVFLGLHPGLGGTFRLPSLIDPVQAMSLMLTGRIIDSAHARHLGLVDATVEERHVRKAVKAAFRHRLRRTPKAWWSGFLGLPWVRRAMATRMRAHTERHAPSQYYPAPHKLISLWEKFSGDTKRMQREEIRSFATLLRGRPAQNLIRTVFLREHLKSFASDRTPVSHAHVVGAGTMGGEIATWCAAAGLMVTFSDRNPNRLARTIRRATAFFTCHFLSARERRDAIERLIPDFCGDGLSQADIVIEAIGDDVEAKKNLFAAIAPRMKATALLATTSADTELGVLRADLPAPDRFVGVHFFTPVAAVELVEVRVHDKASPETVGQACAFCTAIQRLPLPLKSSPGDAVNRVLVPYLMEALLMLEEGTPRETIDRTATDFGMTMGPLQFADRLGLDTCVRMADALRNSVRDPIPAVPMWLRRKVEDGELGTKTGRGLYDYDNRGEPVKDPDPPAPAPDMTDRLVFPILNACVRLLREGVLDSADTVDGALIFATGFAPFRGGPIHYARHCGGDRIVARLRELTALHGPRFSPDEGWSALSDF